MVAQYKVSITFTPVLSPWILMHLLQLLQEGDKVEYRPIGGNTDNVSHSTGTIENIEQDEEGVRCRFIYGRST